MSWNVNIQSRRFCAGAARRVETIEVEIPVTAMNEVAVRAALKSAGIEFIDENGERHRKPPKQKR